MPPSGCYCCGPVPVRAVKEGDLTFKYDAPFVYAEVNADVVTVMKKPDGSTSRVTTSTVVGQKISTKSVGSDAREDITHLYKYPEGRAAGGNRELNTTFKEIYKPPSPAAAYIELHSYMSVFVFLSMPFVLRRVALSSFT